MYSGADTLTGGFPHSEIRGSTIARISPRLNAACHVLHRLLAPRHPPNALLSLFIHTTARAQGQTTPHAATQVTGGSARIIPRARSSLAPGRCASLTHTTTDHLHHVKEHAVPPGHPLPSRGSRTASACAVASPIMVSSNAPTSQIGMKSTILWITWASLELYLYYSMC